MLSIFSEALQTGIKSPRHYNKHQEGTHLEQDNLRDTKYKSVFKSGVQGVISQSLKVSPFVTNVGDKKENKLTLRLRGLTFSYSRCGRHLQWSQTQERFTHHK